MIVVLPPPAALERLKRAERRQRNLTRQRNLPFEPVSVEGLWLLQQGKCVCGECGGVELDVDSPWDPKSPPPNYPVIAHRLARGSRGGHTVKNVEIWAWACNALAAPQETSEAAKVKRFALAAQKPDKPKPPAQKTRKIASRPFPNGRNGKYKSRVGGGSVLR